MRRMAQTSLTTYTENQDTFKNDREKILYYLKYYFLNGATQEDFEPILGKNKHCFSGRFTELIDDDLIIKNGSRLDSKNGKTRHQLDDYDKYADSS